MNVLAYMRTIPSYTAGKDRTEKKDGGERIDADDPANRERIEKLLFG